MMSAQIVVWIMFEQSEVQLENDADEGFDNIPTLSTRAKLNLASATALLERPRDLIRRPGGGSSGRA